jgi:hypothetical protein
MATIKIKKGTMKLIDTDRVNLIEVSQTHDGIAFTFRDNIQLYVTDQYMPNGTKEVIKNTSNSFPTADLEFDLMNYSKPVTASKQ